MKKKKSIYYSDEFNKTARSLIEKIREIDRVESHEIEVSFQKVMQRVEEIKRKSKYSHYYWWWVSVAATIGIVLVIGWWAIGEKDNTGLDISLLNDTVVMYGNEVTLITDDHTMNLKNDASLKYDTLGSLNIQQYTLNNKVMQVSNTKSEMHQIIVPDGKRANITFSDGSKIYINSGSKVVYPDVFEENRREILVEGEVYLDVIKKKECPFFVRTKQFCIRVLGTSFNVCAYNEDVSASVVLVRGSVEVTMENKNKVKLKPNQLMNIRGNETSICKVDVAEYISWKDNLLLLNQRKVGDIFKRLERYYGCKIQYDKEIASILLSGKLDLQSDIIDVMNNLCLSLSLHYTINDKKEIYVSLK